MFGLGNSNWFSIERNCQISFSKRNLKPFSLGLALLVFCYSISGCATAPVRETIITYNINGTTYVPLIALCEQKGIRWKYDSFSKTVELKKDNHEISLRVGDALVLVDSRAEYLNHPVDMYQGSVVVPYRFKERIIDILFKGAVPSKKHYLGGVVSLKKVVVDAGHGGNDPGAIGKSGLREKDVNLDIAKRLSTLLRETGVEVIMTRSSDVFVPLAKRASIANNAKAELFISIHSNASRVRSVNGLEVYYISPKSNDLKRARAAAKDMRPDFDSSCFAYSTIELKTILWDMINTSNRAESIKLAKSVCTSIDSDMSTKILGVKGANFQVLVGTRMPAILIETGFVSNREEERLLRNNSYRQQIAEAIFSGIINYSQGSLAKGG